MRYPLRYWRVSLKYQVIITAAGQKVKEFFLVFQNFFHGPPFD